MAVVRGPVFVPPPGSPLLSHGPDKPTGCTTGRGDTLMPPDLFSDAADPNPDPVQRLGRQATVCLSQLALARTIMDAKVEAEAEWRLNVILDALADFYRMRASRIRDAAVADPRPH